MEKAGEHVGVHSTTGGVHRSSTLAGADFTKKQLFRSTGRVGKI
jgi:hypothetical protein